MMRLIPWILCLAVMPACGRSHQASPDSTTASAPAGFDGAPAGAAGIAQLMQARHVEDLPAKKTLDRHAEPVASLAWLVQHADTAVVKVRAVRALGEHYPGQEGALISGLAADAPLPLRAAALRALGDWPVASRVAHAGVIAAAVGHEDPRVAKAASVASQGLPSRASGGGTPE